MRCFLFSKRRRLLRHISLTILIGLVIGLFIGYIRIIESSSNTELKSPHLIVRSSKLTAVESNPNLSDRSIPENGDKDEQANQIGIIKSDEDQKKKDAGYRRQAFNVLISDRIGLRRSIPDTRHPLCKRQRYPEDLPMASIVICFYNEAWSTLLRTINSVLDRTPDKYLKEIILIDDFSSEKEIKYNFMKYSYEHLPEKVKLYRTPDRAGLVRARLFGVSHATGDVIVFLDSHVEVNVDWLEPLLSRIKQTDGKTIVTPIIDIINADTFDYTASPLVRGGFNWGLNFKWDSIPRDQLLTKKDFVKPIASPTMAGGLFAADKKFFLDLGSYDNGMDIWGGENLELSFRTWMCGGRLEIMPCSRVGHVFRSRRPYGSPTGEDTLMKNSLRVAHVWMDDYIKYYFQMRPDAEKMKYGDISERVEVRQKLQCKSFEWYLKNVYPELKIPNSNETLLSKKEQKRKFLKELKYKKYGRVKELKVSAGNGFPKSQRPLVVGRYQIEAVGTGLCLESEDEPTVKGSRLLLAPCSSRKRQLWSETDKAELRIADGRLCLDSDTGNPILTKCHLLGSGQEWRHGSRSNIQLYSASAGLCLGSDRKEGSVVEMVMCSTPRAHNWNLRSRGFRDQL